MSYGPLIEKSAGYTFQVRAKDTVGNLDPSPAMQTFLVDTTGPTLAISVPSASGIVGASFALTFALEVGSTATCQLDGLAIISPCPSPHTFSGLTSAATHTVAVVGTDAYGNVTTKSATFIVDDVGPGVTISGTPTAGSAGYGTSANLTFAPNPTNEPTPYSFECKFDTQTVFTACTSFVITNLSNGAHTLKVHAKDRFGNVGSTVAYDWTVAVQSTTINAIRAGSVPLGNRVQISGRMTAKTNNRFWMQDVDGTAAVTAYHGITVQPASGVTTDSTLAPGENLTVIGTYAELSGNTTLINATYTGTSLGAPYSAKDTGGNSSLLLLEANEGLYVNSAGSASFTADPSCQNYDYCIVSCLSPTPVEHVNDGTSTGVMANTYYLFRGIVEGVSTVDYAFYVNGTVAQSDVCL
jgi:hypothetical protein